MGRWAKAAMRVMEFVEALKRTVSVPVVTWDERFSNNGCGASPDFC